MSKLFEPAEIGGMKLRNRIVMPAMGTRLAGEFGGVTSQVKDYYAERAKGGVGLIVTETAMVEHSLNSKVYRPRLGVDSDRYIAGLNELVEAVKWHGARIALQLQHPARNEGLAINAISVEEIVSLARMFAEAAGRAKRAGFDAVEVHGAHGDLICKFLSPLTNTRIDQYGGTPEGRMRFAIDVVRGIRKQVGDSYPVMFKISADEFRTGGLRINDTKLIARALESAGVSAICASAGSHLWHDSFAWTIPPMGLPHGCLLHLASEIKGVVSIPVIAVGAITPELALDALQTGKADLVGMGRALIADPEFPKKLAGGKKDDIRPCIRCNRCIASALSGYRLKCTVNAAVGREQEYRIRPAEKVKRVVIVGGGPAGMEAARVATMRGHRVTLYERTEQLGGQLLLAAVPSHKEEVRELISYLSTQLNKLGVKIVLKREATPELIEKLKADVVVIATGATAALPRIPGIDRPNVVMAQDVLAGKREVGSKTIIIGGGMVGAETADFLAEKGKGVTLVEMLQDIVPDMAIGLREVLLHRLSEKAVKVMVDTAVEEISETGVSTNRKGEIQVLEADTVIVAVGSHPDRELLDSIRDRFREVYGIGDCAELHTALEAIYAGSRLAREI